MVDSSVDVCDLMIRLVCGTCSNKPCRDNDVSLPEDQAWSHSKLMDCIKKDFKEATAVGIHAVDDEGAEHYEEITIADTKEHGRWTQTVTKIEILRGKGQ